MMEAAVGSGGGALPVSDTLSSRQRPGRRDRLQPPLFRAPGKHGGTGDSWAGPRRAEQRRAGSPGAGRRRVQRRGARRWRRATSSRAVEANGELTIAASLLLASPRRLAGV